MVFADVRFGVPEVAPGNMLTISAKLDGCRCCIASLPMSEEVVAPTASLAVTTISWICCICCFSWIEMVWCVSVMYIGCICSP